MSRPMHLLINCKGDRFMSGFVAFFAFIAALPVAHHVLTRIIRRGMNAEKEKAWLGGVLIISGKTLRKHKTTKPHTQQKKKKSSLAIGYSVIVKKEYTFELGDIEDIAIKRTGPLLGKAVYIEHNGKRYSDQIYFLCLPFTTSSTLKEIRRIFY